MKDAPVCGLEGRDKNHFEGRDETLKFAPVFAVVKGKDLNNSGANHVECKNMKY